jgi:hypothetical protein
MEEQGVLAGQSKIGAVCIANPGYFDLRPKAPFVAEIKIASIQAS